jgi:carbon storage regulator
MLCLSRKIGQQIIIAGNITITIKEIGRGRVQVGIEAPPEIPVWRREVQDRIDGEKASQGGGELKGDDDSQEGSKAA